MSLCPACRKISVSSLTRELKELPPWWGTVSKKSQARGLKHLDNAQQLVASASAGCALCALIVDAVSQNNSFANHQQSPSSYSTQNLVQPHAKLVNRPIYLQCNYDPIKPSFPEDGIPGSWHIRGLKALVPVDQGVLIGRIRLHTARGDLKLSPSPNDKLSTLQIVQLVPVVIL